MSTSKGYLRPNTLKLWKARKEVYVGYLDGIVSVYGFTNNSESLVLNASFSMHDDAIHSLYILDDLKLALSSSFDSSLKVWKPPETWERKFVVTQGMINGVDPKENLSTIKEEHESYGESAVVRKISGLYEHNPYAHKNTAPGIHSLLEQQDDDD